MTGYRKDITKQQVQNEQLTAILKKVEGESQFVAKQIAGMLEKGERLQEVYSKLARSLEQTESQVARAQLDFKALATEQEAVDRAAIKVTTEIRSIEEEMLVALSEQTTAEKSTSKTGKDIVELRRKVREEELSGVEIQNEMAKLQVRRRTVPSLIQLLLTTPNTQHQSGQTVMFVRACLLFSSLLISTLPIG